MTLLERSDLAITLLSQRWWTVRDLGIEMAIDPQLARWHVQQIARSQPVFARKAVRVKRKPLAYRVFPEASGVKAE